MPEIDFFRPLLAIDCGTAVLSLAVRARGQLFTRRENVGNRQSECLLPMLRELLDEAKVHVPELATVIYNQGPGMFTGLRIGIGVAQGLAAPFAIPLIGVPSVDAAAMLMPDCPGVLVAMDARMGEVFYAWFDTRHKRRLSDYRVGKVAEICPPENIDLSEACGIGNAFTVPICSIAGVEQMPCATDFLNAAQTAAYPARAAAEATLLYVRDKVALTACEQAAAKAAL